MATNGSAAVERMFDAYPADPYPLYAHLRRCAPVYWSRSAGCWFVTRHRDVRALLSHPDLRSRDKKGDLAAMSPELRAVFEPVEEFLDLWMAYSNPPGHTRRRTALKHVFRAAEIHPMMPRLRQLADDAMRDLLQRLRSGPGCLLADFARPFAVRSTSETLGVIDEEWPTAQELCDDLVGYFTAPGFQTAAAVRAAAAVDTLRRYVPDTLLPRGRGPIAQAMASAWSSGHLRPDEVVALFAQLLTGGVDPVSTAITVGLHALLGSPGQRVAVREGVVAVSSVVCESLRFDTPFHFASRVAAAPVEIAGAVVRSGQPVKLVLAAANRDEDVFADPDHFDVRRSEGWSDLLSFSRGIHHCLGHHLARLQIEAALTAALDHIDALRPAGRPVRQRSFGSTAFARVPVGLVS